MKVARVSASPISQSLSSAFEKELAMEIVHLCFIGRRLRRQTDGLHSSIERTSHSTDHDDVQSNAGQSCETSCTHFKPAEKCFYGYRSCQQGAQEHADSDKDALLTSLLSL